VWKKSSPGPDPYPRALIDARKQEIHGLSAFLGWISGHRLRTKVVLLLPRLGDNTGG